MFNRRRFLMVSSAALITGGCQPIEGTTLPKVALAPIDGLRSWNGFELPAINTDIFSQNPFTLLNVWATWCPYCRGEHPFLMTLARSNRFRLIGVVTRDTPEKVREYLNAEGNPYKALSIDPQRKLLKPLRASGVPQTFLINRRATVIAHVSGAMSDHSIKNVFEPAMEKDLRESAQ